MMLKDKKGIFRGREKFIAFILLAITAIVSVKRIFFGLDIDEEYSVALIYRLAQGDVPIKEVWEPHQTSAMIIAPFAKLFMLLTGGSDYLLIFLRLFGVFIGALTALYWYYTFRNEYGKFISFFSAFLFYLILPKWIQSPEFNNMQIWFLICAICSVVNAIKKEKPAYTILSGIFLTLEVMAYPSCIFVFFFFVIWVFLRKREYVTGMVIPPIISFVLFLGYLLSKMEISDIGVGVKLILQDDAHSEAFLPKLWRQLSGFGDFSLHLLIYLALTVVFYFLFFRRNKKENLLAYCLPIVGMLAYLDQLINWVVFHSHLVRPGFYYPTLFIAGVVLWLGSDRTFRESQKECVSIILGSNLVAFISVLIFTNLELSAVFMHLLPSAVFTIMLYTKRYGKIIQKVGGEKGLRTICIVASCILIAVSVYGQFWLIKISNEGRYEDLTLVRQKSLYGASKYVYCEYMEGFENNQNYEFLSNRIPNGSKVLYVGKYNLLYTLGNYEVCSPSTISTPVYGDNIIEYYEQNPDKKPEYIVVSKEILSDKKVVREEFKNWLKTNFSDDVKVESEYLILYASN